MITLTIDGVKVQVAEGTTVLEAARQIGINIPTLCYLKDVNKPASCRVCMVEANGRLLASCALDATEGMEVKTNTKQVRDARRSVVKLILSDHERECTSCSRSENCELQKIAKDLNITDVEYQGEGSGDRLDMSSPSIVRNNAKCVNCGRCIGVCTNTQSVSAIGWADRGFDTKVICPYDKPLAESNCITCGQCIIACPVGALTEKENIDDVWNAIEDEDKIVVVQTAPAVRIGLGDEFGFELGSRVTGKMVAALRRLGFDRVFDTDFAADVTIMEEGTELISRVNSGENLPLMTSCCPGWVKFVEHNYPNFLDNLSSAKSPQEMQGALIKSYFAEKEGIDPKKIVTVSIMPCTAKKFEGAREELSKEGLQDVDYVLTTRELARMIKEAGLNFKMLPEEDFDTPMGESTGASIIFGTTGGVAEAALRTVAEVVTGKSLDTIDYEVARGLEGVKEATVDLAGKEVKIVIAHGLANARKVLDEVERGERELDFIEVMACPGGCINGGGQPIVSPSECNHEAYIAKRSSELYMEDKEKQIRKSHENPAVQKLYKEFLGEPCGHKSHELLHTTYTKRNKF